MRTFTPTEVDMVIGYQELAMAATECLSVQWQVFRLCDSEWPIGEGLGVVTGVSGRMVMGA